MAAEVLGVSPSRVSQLLAHNLPTTLQQIIFAPGDKTGQKQSEGNMPLPQTLRGGKGKPRLDNRKKAQVGQGCARVRSLVYHNLLTQPFTVDELNRLDPRFVSGGEYGETVAVMLRREDLLVVAPGKYSLSTERPADRGLRDAERLAALMAASQRVKAVHAPIAQAPSPAPSESVAPVEPEPKAGPADAPAVETKQPAAAEPVAPSVPAADAPGGKEEGVKPEMAKQGKPERAPRTSQLDRLKMVRAALGDRDINMEKDWEATGLGTPNSASSFFRTAINQGWFQYIPGKFGTIKWLKDPNQVEDATKKPEEPKEEPKKEPAMPKATATSPNADDELAALEAEAKKLNDALTENEARIRAVKTRRVFDAFLALDAECQEAFIHSFTDEMLGQFGLRRVTH